MGRGGAGRYIQAPAEGFLQIGFTKHRRLYEGCSGVDCGTSICADVCRGASEAETAAEGQAEASRAVSGAKPTGYESNGLDAVR